MKTWKGPLAVFLIFLLGFISGASAFYLVLQRKEREVFSSKDIVARLIVYRLDKDLGLTKDQEKAVFDAVLESRREMLTLRKDLLPVFLGILDRTTSRISAVLDETQRQEFDRIVKERRRALDDITREAGPKPEGNP